MKKNKNIYKEMLMDERKAPSDYRKLLKKVKTKHEKDVIGKIIKDEQRHYKLLTKLKNQRFGK